jgi:hypothetical protein
MRAADNLYERRAIWFRFLAIAALWCGCAPETSDVPQASCTTGDPDVERHGTSCLCCHDGDFGVAGSVARDAGVARILVTDRDGRVADMAPNPYGNFFRRRQLSPPLTARIVLDDGRVRAMTTAAPHGSCNACHGVGLARPPLGAP